MEQGSHIESVCLTIRKLAAKRQELGIKDRPVLLLYSRLFEFDSARLVEILAGVKAAVPNVAVLSIGESLYADDAARLAPSIGTGTRYWTQ